MVTWYHVHREPAYESLNEHGAAANTQTPSHSFTTSSLLAITPTGYPRQYRRIPHSIYSYSHSRTLISQIPGFRGLISHPRVPYSKLGLQAPSDFEQLRYVLQSITTGLLESHILQPSTFGIIRMNTWRDGRVRVRLRCVHCYIKKVIEGHGRSWKVSEGSEISRRTK